MIFTCIDLSSNDMCTSTFTMTFTCIYLSKDMYACIYIIIFTCTCPMIIIAKYLSNDIY